MVASRLSEATGCEYAWESRRFCQVFGRRSVGAQTVCIGVACALIAHVAGGANLRKSLILESLWNQNAGRNLDDPSR